MLTAYPPINRYLTPFDSSNFKNSLKARGSDGSAMRAPPQTFECLQPLLNRTGQPVLQRVVRLGQFHDRKIRLVESGFVDRVLGFLAHRSILPRDRYSPFAHKGEGAGSGK